MRATTQQVIGDFALFEIRYEFTPGERGHRDAPEIEPTAEIVAIFTHKVIEGKMQKIDITREMISALTYDQISKVETEIAKNHGK